jgi:hypothetical protein
METHLMVYLYLLLIFLVVEFLIMKKVKISHDTLGIIFLKESIAKKRRKLKGLIHLYHAYFLGFALILKIIIFNVNIDNLPYYFLAIFLSVAVAFIYMYDKISVKIISTIAILFLYCLQLKYILQASLQNYLSFIILMTLLILILYIADKSNDYRPSNS